LTAAGTTFGYLLSGSFIVETFFTIPGIGYPEHPLDPRP
jgi:ABC-type dipeptide/oligopeptide/nickel transport system permease component